MLPIIITNTIYLIKRPLIVNILKTASLWERHFDLSLEMQRAGYLLE